MIQRDEIDGKAKEFDINAANVQRDYVFGWLLFAIYNNSYLSDLLILKGGNCFRKAYFPNTRFSSDLDFSTQQQLDLQRFEAEIEQCCKVAQDVSGINFVTERNSFREAQRAQLCKNTDRKIYKGKIFFVDFHGEKSSLEISVRMDVTEFDKLYMEPSIVPIIHPYSDSNQCQVELRCVAIEEGIASKLKCLLQRRHSHDLYDLVYASFFNNDIELDRSEILRVFLRKTIFGDDPGAAKQILLGLPMPFFKAAWQRYIVCPAQTKMDFDKAEGVYTKFITEIFDSLGVSSFASQAFYPAELRNKILEAGSGMSLMHIRYQGHDRVVEPYALTYKRRKDGVAQEYLYVWDRSGGRSGKIGIKSWLNGDVEELEVLEETFDPQFEVELSKAGEQSGDGYFGGGRRSYSTRSTPRTRRSVSRSSMYSGGPKSVVQCLSCGRQFTRKSSSTSLKSHKDKYGSLCVSRSGYFVRWSY